MNEHNAIDTNDILTDEIIVSYLQDNPDFFQRNTELLTSLRLADHKRGSVSLVERQQQQLRQKIHGLEEEITELMAIAYHNESLFNLYSDLYLRLIDSTSLTEILNSLHLTTTELLSLADCKLWLNTPSPIEHNSIISNDCSAILAERLTKEPFYFGRLQQAEQEALFNQSQAGSAVLIRLAHLDEGYGFLAIVSNDAEHFDPKMDTLLLGQFRKLVGKLIHQQLSITL